MEKGDRFCPDDRGAPVRSANGFSDGGSGDVFSTGDLVRLFDDRPLRIFKWLARVDRRTELAVRQEAVAVRVNARRDGRAVDVRGRDINGVMLLKRHAFLRQLPERRRV